jgi:phosphoglycerate kinase
MSDLYTLDDLPASAVDGQPVLVRLDINVPMHEGEVGDRTRIREVLPTLHELRGRRAKLLIVAHRGRPKGQRRLELSLEPVGRALAEELGQPVAFAADCIGEAARQAAAQLQPGGVCLLENVRFHAGEERNDPAFAQELATLADCYVGDAFGTAHRAHASTVALPGRMSRRAAGRLIAHEVRQLSRLLGDVARPYVAVLGGAKISGKIELISSLSSRVDVLLIGGGMANTFLATTGLQLGRSLVEHDQLETARQLLALCRERGVALVLPVDLMVTEELSAATPSFRLVDTDAGGTVGPREAAVDIGPRTVAAFGRHLANARSVFWNGPMGVFEQTPFDRGSLDVARSIAASPAFSVLGGGETAAVAHLAEIADRVGHISTGGGAALELIAGRTLPGVEALRRRSDQVSEQIVEGQGEQRTQFG